MNIFMCTLFLKTFNVVRNISPGHGHLSINIPRKFSIVLTKIDRHDRFAI